jgi:hypothetical protein
MFDLRKIVAEFQDFMVYPAGNIAQSALGLLLLPVYMKSSPLGNMALFPSS